MGRRLTRIRGMLGAALALGLGACGGGSGGGGGGGAGKVSVGIDGLGRGEVLAEGGGFRCGEGLCFLDREVGTTVTLTAVPAGSAAFTGWSGECKGTGPCTLKVEAAGQQVRAGFGIPGAWSRALGSPGEDAVFAVARDAGGDIWLAGVMGADTRVDGQAVTRGPFLARFDATGGLRFVRRPGHLSDKVRLLALGGGELLLADTFAGTIQGHTSAGGTDILVTRLSAEGAPRWTKQLGGTGDEQLLLLDAGPGGSLYVGGNTAGFQPEGASLPLNAAGFVVTLSAEGQSLAALQMDRGPTRRLFDGRGRDILVGVNERETFPLSIMALDAERRFVWGYEPRSPNAAGLQVAGAHVGADDSLVVAGHFTGYMGDVTADRATSSDVFLMRLSAEGRVTAGRRLGGDGLEALAGMVTDARGHLVLAGTTTGTSLDFGGGERVLGIDRAHQAFLARFTRDGEHVESTVFGGRGLERTVGISSGGGFVTVAGTFEESTHFGDAERTSAGAKDLFLLTLP